MLLLCRHIHVHVLVCLGAIPLIPTATLRYHEQVAVAALANAREWIWSIRASIQVPPPTSSTRCFTSSPAYLSGIPQPHKFRDGNVLAGRRGHTYSLRILSTWRDSIKRIKCLQYIISMHGACVSCGTGI